MGLGLKIKNEEHHNYFVQTASEILSALNFDYSYDEIEKMSIENSYRLYFHNKKTKRWCLGIWAVGDWQIKEQFDGEIFDGGYGVNTYKPLTISVFVIHDWTYDKFRPSYADWEILIDYNNTANKHIATEKLKYTFKHPIECYYNTIVNKDYNDQHREKNKYVAYFKAWYDNVFSNAVRRTIRRVKGYVATRIFVFKTFFDKRVSHVEHRFHKDKWNNEYEIAIVFKYGETEWDDWKVWSDYDALFKKLYKWNIWVNLSYLDEDGNIPKHIWRGVYWTEEPEKP